MKIPQTHDLPLYSQDKNLDAYFRSLLLSLGKRLREMAQAINANDSRKAQGVSTGAGSVMMGSASSADNAGWIEIEEGKWTPYWSNPNP